MQLTPRQVLGPGGASKPANRHGVHSLNNKLKAIHKPSEADKRLQSSINFAYKLIRLLLVRNEVLPKTVPADVGHLQHRPAAGGFHWERELKPGIKRVADCSAAIKHAVGKRLNKGHRGLPEQRQRIPDNSGDAKRRRVTAQLGLRDVRLVDDIKLGPTLTVRLPQHPHQHNNKRAAKTQLSQQRDLHAAADQNADEKRAVWRTGQQLSKGGLPWMQLLYLLRSCA